MVETLQVETDAGTLNIRVGEIEEDEDGHIIMDSSLVRAKKGGKVFFRYDYTEHNDNAAADAIILDEEKSQSTALAAVNTDAIKELIAEAIFEDKNQEVENYQDENDGEEESETQQDEPPPKRGKKSTALATIGTPLSSGKKPKGKNTIKKGKKAERTPAKDLQYKIQGVRASLRGMKGKLEAAENKQENHQQLYDLSVKNLKSRIPREKNINIQEQLTTCQYITKLAKDEDWVNATDFDYKEDGTTTTTDPLHELAQLLRATANLIDSKNESVEALLAERKEKLVQLAEYRRQATDIEVLCECDEAGLSPADLGIKLWKD